MKCLDVGYLCCSFCNTLCNCSDGACRSQYLLENLIPMETEEKQKIIYHSVDDSDRELVNKGDLHGGKTTMLYLNLSGH